MLASARSLRKAIEELMRRIRERHECYRDFSISSTHRLASPISETTWSHVTEFVEFLKPIKGATTMVSGKNYPAFGKTLVVFHLVSKHASKTMADATSWYTRDFARAFKRKIDEYVPFVKTPEAKIAAVLDPRTKAHIGKIGCNIEQVKTLVEGEYKAIYRSKYEKLVDTTTAATQEQKEDAEDESALFNLIDELMNLGEPVHIANESVSSELSRWLNHKDGSMSLKTGSQAVCNWMKNEGASLPRIQMMARDYLAVTATSVPSEEAFSASGATISTRRARLGDDAVTAISELQAFLAFNTTSGGVHASPVDISSKVDQ